MMPVSVRLVHRFTTSIYIYIRMYIGLVGDIGPTGVNGNMGALCPMGTIGSHRTKLTNRTNSPIRLGPTI